MDVLTGEKRHHFPEHVLHECDSRVVRIEDEITNAPHLHHIHRGIASDTEARIGRDRRLRVTGHLDLRHHRHESLGGVCHDFADVVLRVETAVRRCVEDTFRGVRDVRTDECLRATCADLRQPRILQDLNAPALILGEVPVKTIQLVMREQVDVLLDEFLRHEVAPRIEMCAAPREARHVLDVHGGRAPCGQTDRRAAIDRGGQQLAE